MRSKLILALALVMGLITTFLFYNYMKDINSKAAMTENVVEVLVANQPIKKDQKITPEMVRAELLPEVSVHPQAIKDVKEIEGKFVTSNIEKDEMILTHRLKLEEDETLFVSRKVSEGYRAVSIGANFVQSISNLIEPDDYVDVVFSEVIKVGNETKINTRQILTKARVLAVGRRMVESNGQIEFAEYSSVTLELLPNDAVNVIHASERGNIQFTLHTRVVKAPLGGVENGDDKQ